MPIDLFQEVKHHLACADFALSAPHYKDIMLVGRCGVGRRSLVSLIAHMQRLAVVSTAHRGSTSTRNGSGISSRSCR